MTVRTPPALACAFALGLSACAGDGPTSTGSSSQFAELQSEIFDQNCTTAGCHNPQSAAGGLILTDGVSYDALVGVTPSNPTAEDAGLLRVRPFAPDTSFLLSKVTDPAPGQGSRMPLGAEPLSEDQIATIRDWIEAGASETDPPPGAPTAPPTPTVVANSPTSTTVPATDTATPAVTATPTEVASETPTGVGEATDTPADNATSTPTAEAVATSTPTESATVPTVSLEQVQQQIFTPRCATPFCHSGGNPSAQLSLVDGESFDALVGVVPTTAAAAAEGRLRVDPGAPDNSFVLIKVVGPPDGQGARMPLTGDPLTAEQTQLLSDWIAGL